MKIEHEAEGAMRQLPVRMPEETYLSLKGVAYFTEQSMNTLAVTAIQRYLTTEVADGVTVEQIVVHAQEQYRGALDKLKDL